MGRFYQIGISGIPNANVGAAPTYKASSQLAGSNATLQGDIKKVVKQFPLAFTAVQIERQLDMAIRYGKSVQAKHRSGATRGLQLAIADAEKAKWAWQPKAAEMYVYKRNQNKEWQDTYNQVMKIYVESAGFVAEGITLDSAKQQLTADLNPVAPTNIAKYLIIGGAVYLGYRVITGQTKIPNPFKQENKPVSSES